MWKFFIICVVMSALNNEGDAASSRTPSRRRRGYSGSYSGSHANSNGAVGGYTGGYNDYDDYDYGGGSYAPQFGITDPYLFHQQLTNQILAQHYAQQHRIQQQVAAHRPAYHNRNHGVHYGGSGSSNSHRYAPSYAAASGSIGSNGHRQTAYISPANPATPNIVNRFGASSSSGGGGGGGGGYKGVSVSSFSTSNGDGTSRRGAQTTINDNGKVTSYSVHS
ncbi:RNA-binding protein FUS isoform X2 [Drosophila innubila]|uniref:RNA-binding protein FUS isoform X2 n=1 Tax=Drosophila innubila TaxID=198719 RepID=UPI00148D17C6|nr:RNA-binding protein FUS isoform X2 [Drosophila innubila]